ncbi:TetR/AcrR family transcriptional regulator [Salinisphaera hydrothermalis]|uniref:TetR family transcriptional regulator n=1 Tax=Salinisphaera hydrothermalis (strain C41B8) TaxID=1304275 RepID=A0A084IMQ0_SALHC|nr:TetR/AcrR family transcriptional regulator [Salinisphaera hydrothermalis]KEZ77984.1 TetR family transcriptional regulator [Salinisphaera hydrothermalis C41B8]
MSRRHDSDETRTRILAAAVRCVARRGVRGLRMADVGREAGVSSGLLYYHFADRDGLLAATLAHVNDTAAAGRSSNEVAGRSALIDNLVDEISDDPEVRDHAAAWHEINASAVFDERLAAPLRETTADWQARIANALVATAPADAPCDRETAEAEAVIVTALVDGLLQRWLTGRLSTNDARALLRRALIQQFGGSAAGSNACN